MVVIQINGNTVNDPINWQEFGIRIFRDDTINGLFIEYTTELQWNGLGYEIIRQAYNTDILKCGLLTVTVDYFCGNRPKRLLTGNILISECKFDLQRCIVTTKLFDNNYSTRINNNKSIELDAYITESKNGVTLPTYNDLNIQTYIAATGSYYPLSRGAKGKYLTDYLRHMVSFMSDKEVTYSAPILQGTGLTVTSGLSLRTGKKTPIVTSFQKLFEAINKKLNLSITTRGNQLIIDSSTAIYSNQQAIQLDNIRDLIQFVEKERLFSAVEVGNDKAFQEWECNNGAGCSNPQVKGFTFQKDQFGFVGTCNQDIVQDLVSKDIIIDSNIIEDVVVYGNQSFDDNVFIIETIQNPTTLLSNERRATQTNLLGVGNFFYYNGIFSNDKVITNHASDLPNQIANYVEDYDSSSGTFDALKDNNSVEFKFWDLGATAAEDDPINVFKFYSDVIGTNLLFNNLLSGVNFDVTNGVYTSTFPGVYTVQIRQQFNIANISNPAGIGQLALICNRRTADGELIKQFQTTTAIILNSISLNSFLTLNFTTFLNVGDTLSCDFAGLVGTFTGIPADTKVNIAPSSNDLTFPTFFKITQADAINVIVPTINADLFRRINYEFERPLNFEQVSALIDSPERIIRISQQQIGSVDAFIEEILINNLDKFETSFKLISNE
jgi:hypothetical protein